MKQLILFKNTKKIPLPNSIYFLILIPIGFALNILSRFSPDLTEKFYSSTVYNLVSDVIATLTNWIPFSLIEILIIFLPIVVIINIIYSFSIADKKQYKAKIFTLISNILAFASIMYFAFIALEGINYNRVSVADYTNLTIAESSVEELNYLCKDLISDANSFRYRMKEDSNGVAKLGYSDIYETAKKASHTYEKLSVIYPIFDGVNIKPKPVIFSKGLSLSQITGMFSHLTMEANINYDAPAYSIPSTMCHEIAHVKGFMKEDEANFISYLACMNSDEIEFKYSGTMMAVIYSMNKLYSADYDLFLERYAEYSDSVRADLVANSEYWKKYDGQIAKVSNKINDTYLKANNQHSGVQSYGEMVDLLLAYKKQQRSNLFKNY